LLGGDLHFAADSFWAAVEMSWASSSKTRATTIILSSACFHCFCSMASRTAGTVFGALPGLKTGGERWWLNQGRVGRPSAVGSLRALLLCHLLIWGRGRGGCSCLRLHLA